MTICYMMPTIIIKTNRPASITTLIMSALRGYLMYFMFLLWIQFTIALIGTIKSIKKMRAPEIRMNNKTESW
jgi:hypothetical protein